MSETITERDEADAMFDDFDYENTAETSDADVDWGRAEEQTNGFTNTLLAERQHYKEVAEWFDNMGICEFALWKLCKLIHSY